MQQKSLVSSPKISPKLIEEIIQAINNIRGWGSVEIYIQNYSVVQITERNIRKTQHLNGDAAIAKKTVQLPS